MVNEKDKISARDYVPVKPSVPLHILAVSENLIRNRGREQVTQYVRCSMESNTLYTCHYSQNITLREMHSSAWNIMETTKDIELMAVQLLRDKSSGQYSLCVQYSLDSPTIRNDHVSSRIALEDTIPMRDIALHLPYLSDEIRIKNDNVQLGEGWDRLDVVRVRVCDIKNKTAFGPMLIVQVCHINEGEKMSSYCTQLKGKMDGDLVSVIIEKGCIQVRVKRASPRTNPSVSAAVTTYPAQCVIGVIAENWHILLGLVLGALSYFALLSPFFSK